MNLLRAFVIGIAMYSKIPMPKVEWNKENMKYAMCFFPVVGVITGIVMYFAGRFLLLAECSPLFFAGVMTLIPIIINGGIHMDGFMDTMDALSSYGERERKLEILKDSHAGAFAILGLGCYMVWSMAVYSEVKIEALPVIAAGFVLSRALSGFSVMNFPSARKNGLGKTFQERAQRRAVTVVMAVWFAAAAAVMIWFGRITGIVAFAAALAVFFYYRHMAMKQFGGMTGDLAGYFLQLCELAVITAASVGGMLWK